MCDPATFILALSGAASAGSALLGPKPAKPPPIPATTPDAAKKPGATVRVGDGQNDDTTANSPTPIVAMQERRLFGRPIGGLGKSGLSI